MLQLRLEPTLRADVSYLPVSSLSGMPNTTKLLRDI